MLLLDYSKRESVNSTLTDCGYARHTSLKTLINKVVQFISLTTFTKKSTTSNNYDVAST